MKGPCATFRLSATLLAAAVALIIWPSSASAEDELLIKVRLDGDSLPQSIRLEDTKGVSTIDFNAQTDCFEVHRRVPTHGNPPNSFNVVIPWGGSDHHLFFRITPTRDHGEFRLNAKLRRLPARASSVRELEGKGPGLQSTLERYLWARDLFKRARRQLADNHVVTLGALRQWFDAAYKLVESDYNLFGWDEEVEGIVEEFGVVLRGDAAFRRINRAGYFEPLINQAQLSVWRDVAAIHTLADRGEAAAAFKLNEYYMDLWDEQGVSANQQVTKFFGITQNVLESNDVYIRQLVAGDQPP